MSRECLRDLPRCAWRLASAPAAAVAVALLAACGGAGSGGPAGVSHLAGYRQYHAYSRCMQAHGAPFWPSPSEVSSYGVFDSAYTYVIKPQVLALEHGPRWEAALAACARLAPPGLPFTAAQISALRSQLDKLAACMRSHGITRFPGPVVGPEGGGFASPGYGLQGHGTAASPAGVNTHSAQFRAAQRACWVYAPDSR